MLRIELMTWEKARAEATRIRFEVFVEEQKVPREIELDENDAPSLHALAYDRQGRAVATGRLLPDGHIGRIAVLRSRRGTGAGSAILRALMDAAKARGDRSVALSAQTHALDFYRKHGFVPEGEAFEEAGIPHQAMRRTL